MPRLASLLCAAALGALPAVATPAAQAAESALSVEAPYVRLVPPNAPASAAFMVIANRGDADRRLQKADSPVARSVELHTHLNEDGVMKMRRVEDIAIAAHGRTELRPGGLHIMLIDLQQPLQPGMTIPITLRFDDGSALQVDAPVQAIQPPKMH